MLLLPRRRREGVDGCRVRPLPRGAPASRSAASACTSSPHVRDQRRATSPTYRRTISPRRRSPPSCCAAGAFRADVSGAGPTLYGLFDDRDLAERAARIARPAGPGLGRRPCLVALCAMENPAVPNQGTPTNGAHDQGTQGQGVQAQGGQGQAVRVREISCSPAGSASRSASPSSRVFWSSRT